MREKRTFGHVFLYSGLMTAFFAAFLAAPEIVATIVYEEKAFLPAWACYSVDVSPDDGVIYAPTHLGDWDEGVSLYDAHTYALIKVFHSLPNVPKYILASADVNYFYATCYYGGSVVKLRASAAELAKSIPVGPWPVGMVFDSVRRYLYVMVNCPYSGAEGWISIVDTSTDEIQGTIGPISAAGDVLAISPDDKFLYAIGSGAQKLYKMSIAERSVIGTVAGVQPGGMSVSPDGQLLYVADRSGGAVRVFQTSNMAESASIPVADVNGFWVAPSGDHGLAVCLAPGSSELLIRVVGLPGGEVLQTLSHALQTPDTLSSYSLMDPVFWRRTTGEALIPIFREHGGVMVLSPVEERHVVYQSDFSADPGWTTNSSSDFYWNQADGNYHFRLTNGGEEYSYRGIPFDRRASYRLEFDVYMTRCDWAADLYLGLGDSDMNITSPSTWYVSYHKVDQGQTGSLIYYDSEGGSYHPGGLQPAPFQLNTWYHNVATYDPGAGTLTLRATKVSDGLLVGLVDLGAVGSFVGVDRLYMSSVGHTYASGAIAEGYIDNVVLKTNVDIPQPPLVTQFAINGGAATTESRTVTLNNTTTRSPTHYMASESSAFTGATWQTYSTAPQFILSAGDAQKTVYFKTKDAAGESNVVSDTITLQAGAWQVVYQSDFSSDPGWTTNSPQNFYWNQADGTYYFQRTNGAEQYSFRSIPFDPEASYQLEFDVYMTRCDWAASHFLGLGDSDMSIQTATTWLVSYHKVDQGQTAALIFYDSDGNYSHPGGSQPAPFQLNTWYHNVATYDRAAGTLSLRVTKVSDGSPVGQVDLGAVGSFAGVDRLYMSSVSHVYASGAVAEGYIDNLILKKYSPAAQDIIYQSDFSTDPAWITDQPGNYYWNQTEETYHAKVENNAPAYSPNRYFYKAVTWTGDSFELQWDIKMTRADWSAGVSFGLFDENIAFAGFNGGQGVCLEFANPDAGRLVWLYICGAGGLASASSPGGTYAVNTLYTCKLSYDEASGRIYAELRVRDSGSLVWSKTLAVPGGFTVPLVKLGGSRSGFGETGYGGVDRWGIAEAEIDNVVFKRAGVGPLPPVVTQFAINGGAATTQSRTVTLNNTAENNPTHYMASESSDFSGATWQTYSTAPQFILSAADGQKTVYFKTKNAAGESDAVSDTIQLITSIPPGPEITTTSLPNGVEGEPYSQVLQVSGGVPPYTWTIVAGKLPDGLSLDPNTGVISGAPTGAAVGTSTFTIRVTGNQSQGETIYVFGGLHEDLGNLSSVEKYDPVADAWTFVSPMNELRFNHGFASDDQGRIYAIGGTWYGGSPTATVERYDPSGDVWEYVAPCPEALCSSATFTLRGEIYVVGGWIDGRRNACFIYSPATNTWREGPSMYEALDVAGATVSLSETAYVIGGEGPALEARDRVAVLVREGAELVWKPTTPLQSPRSNPAVTAGLDGYVYAIGGAYECCGRGHTNTAERLNEATKTWELIAPMSVKRMAARAVTDSQGRIWVVGGIDGTSPVYLDSVERYDPATGSWTTMTSRLNTGRAGHGMAILPGKGQTDEQLLSITILPGTPWQVVYQSDFSTDPKWTTNDSANLTWDSATGTFHGWQSNLDGTYAYTPIELTSGASFRLTFDARINSAQWSAGLTFGLFDPRLMYNAGAVIDFSLFDVGYTTALYAGNPSGPPDWEASNWEIGMWYRNVIEYDAESRVITLEVRRRDNGALIAQLSLSGISSFPPGMVLLGASRIHMAGYNDAAVDFNLDNIILEEFYQPPKREVEVLPLAGPLLRISWNSEVGKEYQLWATSDLSSGEWVPVGPRMGGTGEKLYVDDYVETMTQGFYRVESALPSEK